MKLPYAKLYFLRKKMHILQNPKQVLSKLQQVYSISFPSAICYKKLSTFQIMYASQRMGNVKTTCNVYH